MAVLSAKNISKYYGLGAALKNVSLELEEGVSFALLGPNGAGKTTFIKIALGLINNFEGEVTLAGAKSTEADSRKLVAYLPEKFTFYPFYTVKGTLEFYGQMRNVEASKLQEQIARATSRVGLSDLLNRKLSSLSKGQLQRVGIASLLIGDTKILVLDEPFSGLDPIAVKEFKELFQKLKREGKTLIFNSHILSEMEKIVDSFAILNRGHLLIHGPLEKTLNNESLEDFFYKNVKAHDASLGK
jgi:ABC-2 type transport system ATP-binding protein